MLLSSSHAARSLARYDEPLSERSRGRCMAVARSRPEAASARSRGGQSSEQSTWLTLNGWRGPQPWSLYFVSLTSPQSYAQRPIEAPSPKPSGGGCASSLHLFVDFLRHAEVVLQRRQCLHRPLFQFVIIAAFAVALEKRDRLFVGAYLIIHVLFSEPIALKSLQLA